LPFVTRFFLVLHILGAIIAVGFSVSYGIWTALGDATGAAGVRSRCDPSRGSTGG